MLGILPFFECGHTFILLVSIIKILGHKNLRIAKGFYRLVLWDKIGT